MVTSPGAMKTGTFAGLNSGSADTRGVATPRSAISAKGVLRCMVFRGYLIIKTPTISVFLSLRRFGVVTPGRGFGAEGTVRVPRFFRRFRGGAYPPRSGSVSDTVRKPRSEAWNEPGFSLNSGSLTVLRTVRSGSCAGSSRNDAPRMIGASSPKISGCGDHVLVHSLTLAAMFNAPNGPVSPGMLSTGFQPS